MEKLTPQNAEQEHMIQILLAKMQGIPVEYKVDEGWRLAGPDLVLLDSKYRIAPQPTPLPISREMWAMIAPEWKWAAMDKDGKVCFYTDEPCINIRGISWTNCGGDYCYSVLATNIDGVSWRLSLAERPEDV